MVTQSVRSDGLVNNAGTLRVMGIALVAFGLIASVLVLFVLPGRCSFVSSLQFVLAVGLLLIGLIILFVRKVILHRMGKRNPAMLFK